MISVLCVFSFVIFLGPSVLQASDPEYHPKKADRNSWTTVADTKIADDIPLAIYQSNRSKLRVAVATVPGPMVNGIISFVTETDSDDGLPHTLEHLVFMGSKKYPYKGILDNLANLNLAQGTNAWTSQDHAAYTLDTVGSKGFLNVLPVYIDHCLEPTLTDAQYLTEVHHINGDGQDAGVVYSEMQNFESDMSTMVERTLHKAMFPRGNGYSVDTGGVLQNLRNSTSNKKVKDYHEKFYNLNNMMIIVFGIIDHNELLSVIEPSERNFLSSIPENFERPFSTPTPPLNESRTIHIETPSDDEASGMVQIAWFGPKATDLYASNALAILKDYLCDTASSPLMKDFVHLKEPYAGGVTVSVNEWETIVVSIIFTGVPVNKLDLVVDRLFSKTLADHNSGSKFDMERMGFLINQSIQKILEALESSPLAVLNEELIGHQIYGDGNDFEGSLAERMNFVKLYQRLASENATFWRDLMQKYFTKSYACVIAQPSMALVKTLQQKEEDRIREQRARLGEEGLKQCEKELEEANRENNEHKPNKDVLKKFMITDLEDFHDIKVSLSDNLNGDASPIVQNLPVPAYLHDVHSKFIEVHAMFDTADMPFELRRYGMLWYSSVSHSSAKMDSVVTVASDVAVLATKEVISQEIEAGFGSAYSRMMHMMVKVEASHIQRAAKWLDIYLNQVIFEPERLAMSLRTLNSDADSLKRDGSAVVSTMHSQMSNRNESNTYMGAYITMQEFHRNLLAQLDSDPDKVLEDLNEFRRLLVQSPVNVHIVCDRRLVESVDAGDKEMWNFLKVQSQSNTTMGKIEISAGEDLDKERFVGGPRPQAIISVGATESSFLMQSTVFPQDWNGEDLVETLLLVKYLDQVEGPLYRGVRGRGLAYGVNIELDPDKNTISARLYRSPQLVQAYEATKSIVMNILKNHTIDEFEFEGAKRSLINDLYSRRGTIRSAATQSMLDIYRNTNSKYTGELSRHIWKATQEDVLAKATPYIKDLFDDSKSIRSVVVPPSKLADTVRYFKGIGVMKISDLQLQ